MYLCTEVRMKQNKGITKVKTKYKFKSIYTMKKTKRQKVAVLYNEDSSRKLLYGSYAKLAKQFNMSNTYIAAVLNPDKPEWSVEIFEAALKLLKKQHDEEIKLQNEIAAIIAAIETN